MNPWVIDRLVRARARELQQEAVAQHRTTPTGRRRVGRRDRAPRAGQPHAAARWAGRLLIRAGARVAGTPVFILPDRPAKAV